jgi:uncharacterized protein YndB with AHSA1/START domain
MDTESSTAAGMAGHEVVITRIFNAPRSLVFKAWTDPEHLSKWFGPKGFMATIIENDARTGGAYHFHMRSPNFDQHWHGIYREVVAPERLVFTWPTTTRHPEVTNTVVTVSFEDVGGGKTRLTLRHATFDTIGQRDDHGGGWNSAFDRLAELVESANE